FAPGPALATQDRSPANVNVVGNYLEAGNAVSSTNFVTGRRGPQSGPQCPLGAFHDQLIMITPADPFNLVANVGEKRLNAEVGPMLRYRRDSWAPVSGAPGVFPFAAPFDPGQSIALFCGVSGQGRGLLPVSQATACANWVGTPPASVTVVGGSGSLDSWSCSV